jgi:hypothetical protein
MGHLALDYKSPAEYERKLTEEARAVEMADAAG